MARYRHPKHGYHVTGYGDDLAALKAAGWVLDVPAPPAVEPAPAAAPEVHPAPESAPAPAPTTAPLTSPPVAPRREWRPKRNR